MAQNMGWWRNVFGSIYSKHGKFKILQSNLQETDICRVNNINLNNNFAGSKYWSAWTNNS